MTDEQLEALEAEVRSAAAKLKNAEISVKDIEDKLKTNEEAFRKKLSDKQEAYKEQTGADLNRNEDVNGRVSYSFSRETTAKEQKKRRKLIIKRNFDSESGKKKYTAEFVDEPQNMNKNISSATDFEKPQSRKKFISTKILWKYGKIELSTDVNNPFLKTVGKPVIVPIKLAAKLTDKVSVLAKNAADSSVGRGVADAAKIISAPIVIPAKIVKGIADKGGVIHSVVDLGDRIKIEGTNIPKIVQISGNVVKGAALGMETASTEAVKGVKNFSIEIAKQKIYEEINSSVSENEATQAAYVIGMKMTEIYGILNEHSKYKRAVRRDIAGNDIVDVNVSRYLAEKTEKKFIKGQDKLKEKHSVAKCEADNARAEYEAAKKRLELYKIKKGIIPESSLKPEIAEALEKAPISKIDKKIDRTKRKLKSVKKHEYKLRLKKAAGRPKVVLERREITGKTPATAWQTKKKLEGMAIKDTAQSLRRKAMRDGGDNSGVEAANLAVTAAQQANRFIKFADEKEKQLIEKKLETKLEKLENQKSLLSETSKKTPEVKAEPEASKKKKKKSNKSGNKSQKELIKKKHHKKAYSNYIKQSKQASRELIGDIVRGVVNRGKSVLILIAPFTLLVIIMMFLTMCGTTSSETAMEQMVSPSSTNDIGLCDRYYTKLAKNMIDKHQNIKEHYQNYNKYVCLTEIDKITHSPEKLLPYVAVKAMSESGESSWNYEQAVPYIEDVFNSQYELYTNEIHEVRTNVTTVVYSNEDSYYSALGESEYQLERPSEDIANPLKSADYAGYANTYTHVEVPVMKGYIENTIENVGVYTDKNGNCTEYDDKQTLTFYNEWTITLVFDWIGNEYMEYWKYTEERQECYDYDYYILEYAINEKNIEVDDRYWTETDENWQDNNFDKLIYNLVSGLGSDEQEGFATLFTYNMGHQELKLPFSSPEISKYPGYNNEINGDLSLDYSIELKTYPGQEIICGMDGEVSSEGENGFSIYNSKYGTLYYEYATVPEKNKVEKGEVISASSGDVLRITFIDNDGNYLNPLFIFS